MDLAAEEYLLRSLDGTDSKPLLRIWEPSGICVVLGVGQKVCDDVCEDECRAGGVPIFRRFSGGGTVVHSPGMVCFSMFLPAESDRRLANVSESYGLSLELLRCAFAEFAPRMKLEPPCDIAIDGRKISGNASRRSRSWVLVHGTLLVDADTALFERCLRHPPAEPSYRRGRAHESFVTTLEQLGFEGGSEGAVERLRSLATGGLKEKIKGVQLDSCVKLANSKYNRESWIYKRRH